MIEDWEIPEHQTNKTDMMITFLTPNYETQTYKEEIVWLEDADSLEGKLLRAQVGAYMVNSQSIPKSVTFWNWN